MICTSGIKERILKLAGADKRLDGRSLEEFRPLEVDYDVSVNAEGSAHVKLGNTELFAGVKLGIGTPYPDTPDSGNLIVNGEITGMADVDYEPGPPLDEEIVLARVVDRGIRESECIDMKKLVITPGEKAWEVYIDVYVVNDDGNLVDACAIGAIAVLSRAVFPKYDSKTGKLDCREHTKKPLPLLCKPITVTIAKIGDYLFVDPSSYEQAVCDAQLSITIDDDGDVNSMQKMGSEGFSPEEVEKCLKVIESKSKLLRKKVFGK